MGRYGVSEDIPEVTWFMGMAPGAPVIVLGGGWDVVAGVGLGVPELGELREGLTGLGSCLSAR